MSPRDAVVVVLHSSSLLLHCSLLRAYLLEQRCLCVVGTDHCPAVKPGWFETARYLSYPALAIGTPGTLACSEDTVGAVTNSP